MPQAEWCEFSPRQHVRPLPIINVLNECGRPLVGDVPPPPKADGARMSNSRDSVRRSHVLPMKLALTLG